MIVAGTAPEPRACFAWTSSEGMIMNRIWVAGVALIAALAMPAAARAHGTELHKVMGIVSSVQDNHVMVKTAAGKTVMVMLDAKTAITRGKTKLDATALKAGDRVVVEGTEDKEMIMAKTVKLGAVTTTAKK